MHPDTIQALIENNIALSKAYITGQNGHFQAIVVACVFFNQSLLARQRLVYNSVHPHIQNGDIHALTIKSYTPEEFESHNQSLNEY